MSNDKKLIGNYFDNRFIFVTQTYLRWPFRIVFILLFYSIYSVYRQCNRSIKWENNPKEALFVFPQNLKFPLSQQLLCFVLQKMHENLQAKDN